MLLHCHFHVSAMAFTGEYWEEALCDVEILKEKIKNAKKRGLFEEKRNTDLKKKNINYLC